MSNDLLSIIRDLPDGKIISLAFCCKQTTSKELRKAATKEWNRRQNNRMQELAEANLQRD